MKGYLMAGALALVTATCLAQSLREAPGARPRLEMSVATGYQSLDFHWSIAGNINGTSPNVYSELIWKAVKGPSIGAAGQYYLGKRFYLSGQYSRVFTQSGKVSDKDYEGDNRTYQTYQGNFNSNRGYSGTWSAAVGYALADNRVFSLVPFIGYGVSDQALYLLDNTPMTGMLNSTYIAKWYGALVRLKATWHLSRQLEGEMNITYNQVNYKAKADWNLIETFQHPVSFSHTADGFGISADVRLRYRLTARWAVFAGGRYANWQTGTGIDQLYLASGQTDKTQMNGAVSKAGGYMVGVELSL